MKIIKLKRKVLMPLITALIIIFTVMTILVLASPPVLTEEVARQSFFRTIKYDYYVYTIASTLYPEGTKPLLPGQSPFYRLLTDEIVFNISAEALELTNNEIVEDDADFNVTLLVRSPEQWEIEINEFDPQVKIATLAEGVIEYSVAFVLPLARAQQIAEAIAEETEVRPREGIQLVVQSELITNAVEGESGQLTAEYTFFLDGALIKASDELTFSNNQVIADTAEKPNHLSLFGALVNISVGRFVFPPFLLFSLIAGAYFVRVNYKTNVAGDSGIQLKRAKLKKHYGSRFIVINKPIEGLAGKPITIAVKDIKELTKVADELERPVLQFEAAIDSEAGKMYYYVVGEEAIYSYQL